MAQTLTWSDLLDNPECQELQKRILTHFKSGHATIMSVPLMEFYDPPETYIEQVLEDFRTGTKRNFTQGIIAALFDGSPNINDNGWVKNPVLTPVQGSSADFVINDTLIYCVTPESKSTFMKYLLVRFLSGNMRYRRFLEFDFKSRTVSIHSLRDDSEFEQVISLLRDYYNKVFYAKFTGQPNSSSSTPKAGTSEDQLHDLIEQNRSVSAAQKSLFEKLEQQISGLYEHREIIQAQRDKIIELENLLDHRAELIYKVRELIENKSNDLQFSACLTQLEELVSLDHLEKLGEK